MLLMAVVLSMVQEKRVFRKGALFFIFVLDILLRNAGNMVAMTI